MVEKLSRASRREREHLPTAQRAGGQWVGLEGRRQRDLPGVHDRLVAVQRSERPRPSLLGQKQSGSPAGVTEAGAPLETEAVDHGEHVGGEAVPAEVTARRTVGRSVTALVEGDAPEAPGQPGGEGAERGPTEPGGVGEQENRPRTTEVVVGDPHTVGGRRSTGGVHNGHCDDATELGARLRSPSTAGPVESDGAMMATVSIHLHTSIRPRAGASAGVGVAVVEGG